MTAGHFGFAAAVKNPAPRVPLWALMVSTYLLDIVFIVLAAGGIETFAPLDPSRPAYGQVVIHAYYTHSLVGAASIAAIAGLIANWTRGRRAGVVIGLVVLSHWVLDLIVHRPDLPILPGNAGGLPLLGFGLWRLPGASAALELLLGIVGGWLYYARARRVSAGRPNRALVAASTVTLLIALLLGVDVGGVSTVGAIGIILLLIIIGGWLDARIEWASSPA